MSDILNEELDSAFVAPARQFKGEELAPYTEGSRILLSQVRDDSDSGSFFVWSFVYMHILIKKDRKAAIALAWNKDKFRETILDWLSDKTKEDSENAENIVVAIINESNKGSVEAIQSYGQGQELGNK